MDKKAAGMLLVATLFVFVLFLLKLYLDLNYEYRTSSRLTYEKALSMSYQEILEFLKTRENYRRNGYYHLLIPAVGLIGFAVGVISLWLFEQREGKKKSEDVLNLLPRRYRPVIELLIEKGGEAAQTYIRQRLGMNKVAVSRLINKMEEEGFVEVDRGRVNVVRLSKNVKRALKEVGFNF